MENKREKVKGTGDIWSALVALVLLSFYLSFKAYDQEMRIQLLEYKLSSIYNSIPSGNLRLKDSTEASTDNGERIQDNRNLKITEKYVYDEGEQILFDYFFAKIDSIRQNIEHKEYEKRVIKLTSD